MHHYTTRRPRAADARALAAARTRRLEHIRARAVAECDVEAGAPAGLHARVVQIKAHICVGPRGVALRQRARQHVGHHLALQAKAENDDGVIHLAVSRTAGSCKAQQGGERRW